MPPSKRASSSHRSSSSHRASSSHRSSSSHRATSSHRSSSSSHRSSSSYRSSSYSNRGRYSHGSSSSGLIGLLFGLNNSDSSTGSYDSTTRTISSPMATVPREYVCKYCDTTSTFTLNGDESLVCPVCGAPIPQSEIENMSVPVESMYEMYDAGRQASGRASRSAGRVFAKLMIIPIIFFALYIFLRPYFGETGSGGDTSKSLNGDSIYVPALSRTVYWNSQYDSFYDQPTDCYFYYNEDVDPADWQYYFEGVSSDYEDCGWMEWDSAKEKWYISPNGDDWEELPSKYDTTKLWHF